MRIGGGGIWGALFNFFVVKKCPFCIFWMLPSVSKVIPGYPTFLWESVDLCKL